MLHGQKLCMTKANSENCYWKVQFFLSHRAVNYACIVLIHRLNRAHTHVNTQANTHIVLVCCVSACVPKKKKPNVESQLHVLVCCCGYTLYFTRTHTNTHTHYTSATHIHTCTHATYTIKMIALANAVRRAAHVACSWWMSLKLWSRCDNSNTKTQQTHTCTPALPMR